MTCRCNLGNMHFSVSLLHSHVHWVAHSSVNMKYVIWIHPHLHDSPRRPSRHVPLSGQSLIFGHKFGNWQVVFPQNLLWISMIRWYWPSPWTLTPTATRPLRDAGAQRQNAVTSVVFVLLTEQSCFYFNEPTALTLRKKKNKYHIYNLNCNWNLNPATSFRNFRRIFQLSLLRGCLSS